MRRVGGPTVSDQVGAQGRNRLKVSEAASEEKAVAGICGAADAAELQWSKTMRITRMGPASLPPRTPHPPTHPSSQP